ncbi:MAG: hypothetical protein P0116_11160 [Candidatus Nitrosocosmicus sp.]|nr:hypothetical protein [Candidatus Nitrosocosmicus sp.]
MGFNKVKVIKEGLSIKPLSEPVTNEDRITVTYIGRLKNINFPTMQS